jgi:hypothetical protein
MKKNRLVRELRLPNKFLIKNPLLFAALCALVLFAIPLPVSAQEGEEPRGFTIKVDIDADFLPFTHTEVKNDEYVNPADRKDPNILNILQNGNYDDLEIKFNYSAPSGLFGAVSAFNFPVDFPADFTKYLGDIYGWVKPVKYFGVQLGKYTDRVIDKIGGDKDLGVLTMDVVRDDDIGFSTTDSLGLGDSAIGLLLSGYCDIGPGALRLNLFAAPDSYHNAVTVSIPNPGSTAPRSMHIPAYYAYHAGGALRWDMDILNIGASYRQAHTEGSGTALGNIYHDWGLYAVTDALEQAAGLKIAAGYSGRIWYEDEYQQEIYEGTTLVDSGGEPDAKEKAPVHTAIHLDLQWDGDVSGKNFSVDLYNNCSFFTLEKEKTARYDEAIAASLDMYADESMLVLYNELVLAYDLTPRFTPELKFRNYYGKIVSLDGVKSWDYGKDVFLVQAMAHFKVAPNTELRAGVKFENSIYGTPEDSLILKNSSFTVAVPLGLTIVW